MAKSSEDADQQRCPTSPHPMSPSSANLSRLVKEMVKEMDDNDFYSRNELYDDSAEEPWFNIRITLERSDGDAKSRGEPAIPAASLRKPWSEFQRLHYLLLTDEFGCNEEVKAQLPPLPPGPTLPTSSRGRGDGHGSGRSNCNVADGLDAYLKALLGVPAVVQSQVFSGFLEHSRHVEGEGLGGWGGGCRSRAESGKSNNDKNSTGGGAPKAPETAVDFLLQPFDYREAYVPRRSVHTECIDVLRGESVVWKFEVLDHLDINFSVVFRPHPVALPPGVVDDGNTSHFTLSNDAVPKRDASSEATSSAKPNERTRRSGWWGGGGSGSATVTSRENGESKEKADSGAKSGKRAEEGGGGGSEGAQKVNKEEKDQTVHLPTRYSTGGGDLVQGSFTCPSDGTCTLRWDNSYSRLRGKRLRFVVESATVATMRAAIEAAGAAEHKKHTTRSSAAQAILDSGQGEVRVSVTTVGLGDDLDRDAENTDNGDSNNGSGYMNLSYYHPSNYRFGRVRRIAASLLRDLGALVDAQETTDDVGGGSIGSGPGSDSNVGGEQHLPGSESSNGGDGRGGRSILRLAGSGASVDARGVETLVARFEVLEDEVASASARRAQSEAQAKVLLANLQKANTKADRLERSLDETLEILSATRRDREDVESTRDEALAEAKRTGSRLQASEEELLRSKRELDLLQAERSVWQVARSGIQEELAKTVADLELERHRHEDTSRALAKAHESRAHAEAEVARLSRRLEEERGGAGGIRAALAAEREAARLAREEAEDARAAVAELDAAVAELGAQKRVLVAGLRARERTLGDRCAAAEARAEEAGMLRRAAEARARELEEEAERREAAQADGEIRLQRLRAEKKVLLAEIRRGAGGGASGGGGTASGSMVGGGMGGRDRGGEVVGDDVLGDSGSEAAGGAVGVDIGRKGVRSPRGSGESVLDKKATLKQLSRQLVHLRERQHHLREDLQADPTNLSAQRLTADVDRAVKNLETRIKRLLSVVAGSEREDEASSTSGSPTRKVTASLAETQETSEEVETYSV